MMNVDKLFHEMPGDSYAEIEEMIGVERPRIAKVIEQKTAEELFDIYLRYNGIISMTDKIIRVLDKLRECEVKKEEEVVRPLYMEEVILSGDKDNWE